MEKKSDMNEDDEPQRASEWLALLLERPDDSDLQARFDAWLAADPENATDWGEIARTYEVMGATVPLYRDHWGAYEAVRGGAGRQLPEPRLPVELAAGHRMGHETFGSRWRARILGAVATAIAACLVLVAVPEIRLWIIADYVTATAESRRIDLDDGSIVRLGPESAIKVAYGDNERRMRLLRGKAYFEVIADANRPFRVRADRVDTTVLGTAFEVRMSGGGTDVAVRRGRVQVRRNDSETAVPVRLRPGDWVRMAPSGQMTQGNFPAQQVASWLGGQLIARDRPVTEVVDQLRSYFPGVVILRGEHLARRRLTGVYSLSDPVAALRAIAAAQGAAVYLVSPWVVVISGT
ncbi:MAG: FecR domain-containing protein [Alphaproteobacteria bacterium]